MPKVKLSAINLTLLADGYTGKVLDEGIKQIVKDLLDRGHDLQKRKLTLAITFDPKADGRVNIIPQVSVRLPDLVPPMTQAKLDMLTEGLIFVPEAAENPDQRVIDDQLPDRTGE